MTQDAMKALSDAELEQVLAWGEQEKKDRAAKRKQETIAKIKEMARSVEIEIKIDGKRGRPAKNSANPLSGRTVRKQSPILRNPSP